MTAAEFQELSAVPLEAEWFANIDNPTLGYASPVKFLEDWISTQQEQAWRHNGKWLEDENQRALLSTLTYSTPSIPA